MDTAFEILAFQSSSSYTVSPAQPLSSTDSTLPQKVQTSVAFYIPFGDKKTVCPSARLPRRLRKGKVAPERTVEDVKKKMRAAEERKLKELQRIRECARNRAAARRVTRNRSRISAAQAFAMTKLQSSIKRKLDKTEQRKQKRQQKIDKQNKLRGKYAKKIKDRVSFVQCYS